MITIMFYITIMIVMILMTFTNFLKINCAMITLIAYFLILNLVNFI